MFCINCGNGLNLLWKNYVNSEINCHGCPHCKKLFVSRVKGLLNCAERSGDYDSEIELVKKTKKHDEDLGTKPSYNIPVLGTEY